jgi:hypothetical protein
VKPTKHEVGASLEFLQFASGRINPEDCRYLGKRPARRKQSEAAEQTALFRWAELTEKQYPELRLLHHIPNGGRRDAIEGAHLKAQGVRSGVPDICLPVARGSSHGLYIELKAAGGRVQDTQRVWLEELTRQGYKAAVCYGFEEAKECIIGYLSECK